MANGRDSGEQDRKLEGGSLEKQGLPAPVQQKNAQDGLHPAFYIVYGALDATSDSTIN